MNFERDEKKNKINIKKHGVSFLEPSTVFLDENSIIFDDKVYSINEEMFLLLGMSEKNICMVAHCLRESDEIIRIISARKATKKNQKHITNIRKDRNNYEERVRY